MIETESQLLDYLERHGIAYQYIKHPPVYTCEQAEQYRPDAQGVSTKNLFLRDRRGRFFLLMTDCDKRMNLKALGKRLGASKLHFAPEDKLAELLGVTPGAVTVLGLVNDSDGQVELWVDEEIWDGAHFLCHPLVNTSTLVISKGDLQAFFDLSGHAVQVVEVPAG